MNPPAARPRSASRRCPEASSCRSCTARAARSADRTGDQIDRGPARIDPRAPTPSAVRSVAVTTTHTFRSPPVTASERPPFTVVSTGWRPVRSGGTDVQQQRTTRSTDIEALAFVVVLFALLLILSLTLGTPIA